MDGCKPSSPCQDYHGNVGLHGQQVLGALPHVDEHLHGRGVAPQVEVGSILFTAVPRMLASSGRHQARTTRVNPGSTCAARPRDTAGPPRRRCTCRQHLRWSETGTGADWERGYTGMVGEVHCKQTSDEQDGDRGVRFWTRAGRVCMWGHVCGETVGGGTRMESPHGMWCLVAHRGPSQGLTLVPVSAQLELTLPLSAQLKLSLSPI